MDLKEGGGQELFIPSAVGGFRIFRIIFSKNKNAARLGSLYVNSSWEPGINKSKCVPPFPDESPKNHSSPNPECLCGLQAYYDFDPDLIIKPGFFNTYAIASVIGGGKTMLHPQGWRAERAQIAGLFMPDYSELIAEKEVGEIEEIQEDIAEIYRVGLFRNNTLFKKDLEKRAVLIKKGDGLAPKRPLIKKYIHTPHSIDDEIDVHGGDASMQILSSVSHKNYIIDDYPKTALGRKRSVLLAVPWRINFFTRHLDKEFSKIAAEKIKEMSKKHVLKLARFVDSGYQLIIPLLFILSILFVSIKLVEISQLKVGLITFCFLTSYAIIIKTTRLSIRKKMLKLLHEKIKSK